jgi:hypothetical protein
MPMMTEAQVSDIRLGRAYMWRHNELGTSTFEDRLAFRLRVRGMPGESEAKIVAASRPGQWTFLVNPQGQSGEEHSAGRSFNSKEEALEGLRAWLVDNLRPPMWCS